MKRVLFVSSGLGVGGAERALEALLPGLQREGLQLAVVSLREPQEVGARLRALGVEVHELCMAPSRPGWKGLRQLWRVVREFRPDVIQGWMYHGNLAAQAARLAAPRAKVVLAIHQTLARLELERRATRAVIRLDAWLSRYAARVLYVAQAAQRDHEAYGYARRAALLPNAVDCLQFRPDPVARSAIRAALGVGDAEPLVVLVGRFHPAKNHAGFLRAAAMVAEEHASVRFLLIGAGVTAENPALAPLLKLPVLRGRVSLPGPQADVSRWLAASDVAVLSSIQEALPNVVSEAMACGLPCVVTDVGDAARMVGDTGWVVPPEDDDALAGAILAALAETAPEHLRRGAAARRRAQDFFDLAGVVQRYRSLYETL